LKVVKDALCAPQCGRFFFEKSILDNLAAPRKLEQARGEAKLSPKRFPNPCDASAPQRLQKTSANTPALGAAALARDMSSHD